MYQDLKDLIDAVQKKGKTHVDRFDTSVFNGEYVTGDVTEQYLADLEAARNDTAKAERDACKGINVVGLHNHA